MSKLICLAGMNKGDQFPLHEGKTVVGRNKDCSVLLFDKKCSHQHCAIHKREHHYSIEDMQSSNGTWLNGKKLRPFKAVSCDTGDLIQVGQTALKISERPMGDTVDQAATDIADELRDGNYDKLLKDASLELTRSYSRKPSIRGIRGALRSLFFRRR